MVHDYGQQYQERASREIAVVVGIRSALVQRPLALLRRCGNWFHSYIFPCIMWTCSFGPHPDIQK